MKPPRQRTILFPCALLLALALTPSWAQSQEWTRFRGPDGTGLGNAEIPAQWTEKDINWRVELPGGGHSSPVLWGDKIFLTAADEDTATRYVVCLNAADGQPLWTREYVSETYPQHGDNSYASATPAVDADRVYICWSTPREYKLVALDHEGKDAWEADLGPYKSQHGSGNSPVVFGDVVVLGNEQEGHQSFLIGVDRNTGHERWKLPRKTDRFSASTPCVFRPKDGGAPQLVFTSKAHGVAGVDPANGALLWELGDVFDSRTVGSPAPASHLGLVFATCGEGPGGHWMVAVRPGDGKSKAAEVAYKITPKTPYVPSPIAVGDLLFYWSDTGVVTCAKAATGETVWQQEVPGDYYGSPVCTAGRLFNVSKQGEVIVLGAAETFQLLGRNPLNELCHTTPAIAGGRMYVRTLTHLISVGGQEAAALPAAAK